MSTTLLPFASLYVVSVNPRSVFNADRAFSKVSSVAGTVAHVRTPNCSCQHSMHNQPVVHDRVHRHLGAQCEEVAVTFSSATPLPVRRLLSEELVVCDANGDMSAKPGTGAWQHPALPIVVAVAHAVQILLAIGPLVAVLHELPHAASGSCDHQGGNLVDIKASVKIHAVVSQHGTDDEWCLRQTPGTNEPLRAWVGKRALFYLSLSLIFTTTTTLTSTSTSTSTSTKS